MTETIGDLRARAIDLHQKGDLDEAGLLYAAYLKRSPRDSVIWSNFGVLLRKQQRHIQAVRAQKRAVALAPDNIGHLNNYANILSDVGEYDASIAQRRLILDQDPSKLDQLAMIGKCLRAKGDYQGAIAHLIPLVERHPDFVELRLQLAFAQLAAGQYRQGFQTYKIRWQGGELTPRDLSYPEWQGEPLDGKTVLVMPEQGFGDMILFARFLPVLKQAGAKVYCLLERPLAVVLDGLAAADWTGMVVPPSTQIDYYVNVMDLAAEYFAKHDEIPAPVTVNIPTESVERAAGIVAPFQNSFKVGVVWTGSVTYKGNAFRSFSHTDFLPLTDLAGVQLFSLYKGPMLEPYFADGSAAFIVDAGSDERGFADTAATMLAMDLIITSDTVTAHLAGSLGVPTWTILHWDPFWFWTHEGDTTGWYPNMTLFRQKTPLQWSGVMEEVRGALSQYLEEQT